MYCRKAIASLEDSNSHFKRRFKESSAPRRRLLTNDGSFNSLAEIHIPLTCGTENTGTSGTSAFGSHQTDFSTKQYRISYQI